MGKASRDKGQRGEREAAKMLGEWWGSEFTRTPSSGGFKTKKFRNDWNAEGDIVTPDETFPFCVECKWQENWTMMQLLTSDVCDPWQWWEQTVKQTMGTNKIPLLIFKKNRYPWFYMTFDCVPLDFIPGRYFSVKPPMPFSWESLEYVRIGKWDDLKTTTKNQWVTVNLGL